MICGKCGRILDDINKIMAFIDPEYGNLCLSYYNEILQNKAESIKSQIKLLTNRSKGYILKENTKERKSEK